MISFGCWMLTLGALFLLAPFLAKGRGPRFERLARRVGFPTEPGTWSELFGVALASFGLFYFVAALLDVRVFHWMSAFGRLGVFGVCVLLSWRHDVQSGVATQQPRALLWFAVPDLMGGTATACLLLGSGLEWFAFLLSILDLIVALGFFTFPKWLERIVGIREKGETWNLVFGALLAFFGVYGVIASVVRLTPIVWISVVARVFIYLALLFYSWPRKDEPAAEGEWRLRAGASALLVASVVALAQL